MVEVTRARPNSISKTGQSNTLISAASDLDCIVTGVNNTAQPIRLRFGGLLQLCFVLGIPPCLPIPRPWGGKGVTVTRVRAN